MPETPSAVPEKSAAPPAVVTDVSSDGSGWDAFLRSRDDATVFHDPRWGRIMQRAYGSRPYYLTARRGGQVVGTLQLIHQKSLLFGSHLCSLPYFDFAGILAADDQAAEALLEAAGALRQACRAEWVELRHLRPVGGTIPARTDKVTLWLPLAEGAEAMWNQLKSKVRTKVRKSQKLGLTIDSGGRELLDAYCGIYARAMRDLGSPPHSRRFFRTILEEFGEAARIFVARSEGGPIAVSFALLGRRGFHVPWSGSDRRVRGHAANRFMWWEMLAHAADARAGTFDFGRSTKGSGTYEFKKEWGAEDVQLYWQYLVPPGAEPPSLRPDSPKYRLMVAAWRRLPMFLARALGPRIISKLS